MPLTGALDVFLRRGKAMNSLSPMKTWLFLAEFFVCGRAGPLLWQITPPVFAHSGTTGHSMLDTEEPLPSRTWHIPTCFLSYWPQFGPLSFPSRQLLLNPCPHSPFSRREACPQESWGGKRVGEQKFVPNTELFLKGGNDERKSLRRLGPMSAGPWSPQRNSPWHICSVTHLVLL